MNETRAMVEITITLYVDGRVRIDKRVSPEVASGAVSVLMMGMIAAAEHQIRESGFSEIKVNAEGGE